MQNLSFVISPSRTGCTNGAAERFNRTLKGAGDLRTRIFRNLEELRPAVGEFVDRYNAH